MFRSVMTTLVALSLALGCAPKVDFEAVCTRALEPELPPEATTVQWSNLEVETLYRFVEVRGQLELTGRLPTFDDSMPDVTVSSYFACQIDENHVILTRSDEPIRSFASRLEEGEDLYFERALGQGTAISGPAPLVTQQQVDCAVSTDEAVSIAFRNSFKMLHPAKDEAPDFDKVAEGLSSQAQELAKIDTSQCTGAVQRAMMDVAAAFSVDPTEPVRSLEELAERNAAISETISRHDDSVNLVRRAAGDLVACGKEYCRLVP